MKKCKSCYLRDSKPCYECSACARGDDHYKYYPTTHTNADRIRGMSDEELAEFITLSPEMEFNVCLCCKNGNPYPDDRGVCLTKHGHCEAEARCEALKDWLKQPVKEEHYE